MTKHVRIASVGMLFIYAMVLLHSILPHHQHGEHDQAAVHVEHDHHHHFGHHHHHHHHHEGEVEGHSILGYLFDFLVGADHDDPEKGHLHLHLAEDPILQPELQKDLLFAWIAPDKPVLPTQVESNNQWAPPLDTAQPPPWEGPPPSLRGPPRT